MTDEETTAATDGDDSAATLLNLLGYEKPDEYDPSLITVG